ncbi:MAG: hypothetical protein WAZ98_03505 [Cyclobacteriaceae bacterium]
MGEIKKDKAKKWVDSFKKDGKGAKSVMFKKDDVIKLLNQKDCEGLRIYNAHDSEDKKNPFTMFLVATKADGTNLLPDAGVASSAAYFVWDDGLKCPPDCPTNDL